MNTMLTSLLTGLGAFFVMFTILGVKEEKVDLTHKRLKKVKNKSFKKEKELSEKISLIVADTNYRIKFLGKILRNFKLSEYLKTALFVANSKLQVDTFLFICILSALPFILLIGVLASRQWMPVGLFGIVIPFILLKGKINHNAKMFTQQFPDALNLISSSLRAGHPLLSSFETVVTEMPSPVNKIFKTAVDEISLGGDVKEALNGMIDYVPSSMDLKFFVTAVIVQREVGGNLAELLDGLSLTIRERFKLLGQLRAQTAQTRFSGLVLSIMPPVVGVGIFMLNPEYMKPFLTTEQGHLVLLLAIFLTLLGLYFIQKITNIEM